jgi:menaquinone-dependent protoporphyrinogen IX oxidase
LRALVFYASTHGHTAKIASRVAEAVRQADIGVDILDARHDTAPEPSGYDGTILAAS